MNEVEDDDLSFIKVNFCIIIFQVINAGRSFYVHNVIGHVQSRVIYYLMNTHILPRSIYLSRCANFAKNVSDMVRASTTGLAALVGIHR